WDATADPTQGLSLGSVASATVRPAFSPDGKMLAHAYYRGVEVRDLAPDRPRFLLAHKRFDENIGSGPGVTSITFSPDCRTLATACWRDDGEPSQTTHDIRLWNLESGRIVRSFQGLKDRPGALVFSPDGNTLAFLTATFNSGRLQQRNVKL